MARLGRRVPNRPILLRNPSFNQSTTVTGTITATLDAVTMSMTGIVYVESGGAPNAVGNMVGSMNSAGGTAFGGNVVHMVERIPRRIRRPTRVR